jgi:hypothetical protein
MIGTPPNEPPRRPPAWVARPEQAPPAASRATPAVCELQSRPLSVAAPPDVEESAPRLRRDNTRCAVTPEDRLIGLIIKHRIPAADVRLAPEHFYDPDLQYVWKRWVRLGREVDQLDERAIRARTDRWARFAVWLIDEAGASDSDNPTNPETEIAALAEQIRGREPPPPLAATDAVEILPPVPALLRRPNGGATDIESMPPGSDPPEPNAQPQANGGSIEQPAGDDNSIQLDRQARGRRLTMTIGPAATMIFQNCPTPFAKG